MTKINKKIKITYNSRYPYVVALWINQTSCFYPSLGNVFSSELSDIPVNKSRCPPRCQPAKR
jgi:hypothetical protein